MGVTSKPKITAQLLAAQGLVSADPFRTLIVGQIGSDGNAVSEDAYQDIQDMTIAQITNLFGTKGEMTGRILKHRKEIKGRVPIWAIGITEAAGTPATVDIAVVGAATEAGTIKLKLIDSKLYTILVDVASGDANTVVSVAIETAINLLTRFPATALDSAGTVTLTANDDGTIPNKYTIEIEDIPAGLTITGSPRLQFTSGATDPTLTTILDNVASTRFQATSWPWDTTFTVVQDFLEDRNTINNAFLHGVAYLGIDDTEANLSSKVNGGTPLNSPNLIFMGNRQISSISVIITPPDWRCAELMAIEALRQTENVPLGEFVTVSTALDLFGGPGLASLAYYNTPMALTDIAEPEDLFSETAQDNLRDDGFTIIGINESRSEMIMSEVVSTYKFNSRSEDDTSFKYLNYIRTGYLALEIFFNNLKSDYSQFRLTEGDLVADRSITNETQIKSNYLRLYKILSGPNFTLTQAGDVAEKYFSDNLTISVNLATGVVTSNGKLPIVTQVRAFNITFQMSFNFGG